MKMTGLLLWLNCCLFSVQVPLNPQINPEVLVRMEKAIETTFPEDCLQKESTQFVHREYQPKTRIYSLAGERPITVTLLFEDSTEAAAKDLQLQSGLYSQGRFVHWVSDFGDQGFENIEGQHICFRKGNVFVKIESGLMTVTPCSKKRDERTLQRLPQELPSTWSRVTTVARLIHKELSRTSE